jgi:hypothetical protein
MSMHREVDGDRFFHLNDLAVLNTIRDGLGIDFRRPLSQIIRDNVPGSQVADATCSRPRSSRRTDNEGRDKESRPSFV